MKESFLDRVIKRFSNLAEEQEQKGIEKYGHEVQPLEQKYDWIRMAEEEFVDGMKYLHAERERRDELLKQALRNINSVKVSWVAQEDEGINQKLSSAVDLIKIVLGMKIS